MAWLAPLGTALALGVAAPAPATDAPDAVSGPGVGALRLRLPEAVSEPDQDALNQRFGDGLERSGLSATPVPAEASACEDAACYKGAAEQAGVELLVGGTVQ